MKRTAPKLKKLYNRLNRKYFGNRLPKNTVVYWSENAKWSGDLGTAMDADWDFKRDGWKWVFTIARPVEIMISAELKKFPRQAEATLIHEMVHVDLFPTGDGGADHGPKFQAGMMRLAKLGALRRLW